LAELAILLTKRLTRKSTSTKTQLFGLHLKANTYPFKAIAFTWYGLLLLSLSFFSVACKSKKDVAEGKDPIRNRTAGYLLKRYEENKFDYQWLGMKIDADFETAEQSQSFKATLRMKKDSAIWISITPLLGIEMIRLLVTPDTLKYLSKIPDNKFYYIGPAESIGKKLGVDLDFEMLQDLLIGNAIGLEKDEARFRSEIDKEQYLLISRYRRKVRRMVGVDDRKLEDDTIVINPNDPRYQRTIRKIDENEGIIVSRYWLEPDNFKLVKSVFSDIVNQRTMDIRYDKFQQNGEVLYPSMCNVSMSSMGKEMKVSYEITRLSSDKAYDFPFEIPEDFARKDSL